MNIQQQQQQQLTTTTTYHTGYPLPLECFQTIWEYFVQLLLLQQLDSHYPSNPNRVSSWNPQPGCWSSSPGSSPAKWLLLQVRLHLHFRVNLFVSVHLVKVCPRACLAEICSDLFKKKTISNPAGVLVNVWPRVCVQYMTKIRQVRSQMYVLCKELLPIIVMSCKHVDACL